MAAETWPLKRVAELAGDVVIGGLHMIHERNARMTCGPIMPQGGVQVSVAQYIIVDYDLTTSSPIILP